MKVNISVIGGGSWGTAIAILLSGKGHNVKMWVRRHEMLESLNVTRENKTYLSGVMLPRNIEFTNDIEYSCKDTDIIVVATPSHVVREIGVLLKKYINDKQHIVSLSKGIENITLKRMSEVLHELMPINKITVMSGPCHAEEVARDIPTAIVATSCERAVAEYIQDVFITSNFRVYTNPDIVGVEMGGALKNIIALGAGIIDGLGYGDNTKSALMTRGIAEMARLGSAMGANRLTFGGLSGIGDLIVTCTSMHSRNRKAGIALGKGKKLNEILSGTSMVVEGIKTTESAYQLSKKYEVDMPITQEIYNLLYRGTDAKYAVDTLMTRTKTHEIEGIAEINDCEWT